MTAGGYRVEPGRLRNGGRRLHELSDELRASAAERLAPPPGSNEGFTSIQAARTTAEAWQAETGELATVLRVAGDKLGETAAAYDRADSSGAQSFERIRRGG
ncbi:MAG TPA: hypothetical protein VGJ13_15255 [Pseudonocardiaceae bacterium]|jgi:hypothetical protein